MAKTESRPVVLDAGPLIHLDELNCLDLLGDFHPLIAPPIVWQEAVRHRPHLLKPGGLVLQESDVSADPRLAALTRTSLLDAGERAALNLLLQHRDALFLTDDAAARVAAESLGIATRGTLGILVRSIRRGLRSKAAILSTLATLRKCSTLHVSQPLLEEIIRLVADAGAD
jgi:predicted nucleic acid-binding protein